MRSFGRFCMIFLLAGAASAQELFVAPDGFQSALAPGTFIAGSFVNAGGERAALPAEGRYLLLVAESALALETRERVPLAEYDPSASADAVLANTTVTLLPELEQLGDGYVVFYNPDYLPPAADYGEVQTRLAPWQVLFDGDEALPLEINAGGFMSDTNLTGLYFMEGQTIRYRYLGAWTGPSVTRQAILEGARTFLAGGEPERIVFPAVVGAKVPKGSLPADGPALVLMVADSVLLDTPEDDAPVQPFLLRALPPVLEEYGVPGVALTLTTSERLPEIERRFPGWTFVLLGTEEKTLPWLEFGGSVGVINGANELEAVLWIVSSERGDDGPLRQALRAVSPNTTR